MLAVGSPCSRDSGVYLGIYRHPCIYCVPGIAQQSVSLSGVNRKASVHKRVRVTAIGVAERSCACRWGMLAVGSPCSCDGVRYLAIGCDPCTAVYCTWQPVGVGELQSAYSSTCQHDKFQISVPASQQGSYCCVGRSITYCCENRYLAPSTPGHRHRPVKLPCASNTNNTQHVQGWRQRAKLRCRGYRAALRQALSMVPGSTRSTPETQDSYTRYGVILMVAGLLLRTRRALFKFEISFSLAPPFCYKKGSKAYACLLLYVCHTTYYFTLYKSPT